MKKLNILLLLLFLIAGTASAQRPFEKLNRSVIAQPLNGGVYVNWRIMGDEYENTSYKLFRNGTLIHETGATGASNYHDAGGTAADVYTVTAVKGGVESTPSTAARMISKPYLELPLRNLAALGKTSNYIPNDATTADLDGDGEYEIILKRTNKDWSTSATEYTLFEAYKLDGTFLWAIDVGPNILPDVETNIAAFDFDGDGKAEVFMRTSEGTIFGDGTKINDTDGDGVTDYRYGVLQSANMQYATVGPEFLSLINGETGAEMDRIDFIPRGNVNDWGDGYGHRASKYFFGAPYLDGQKPSLFIGRGIYTKTVMRTYDIVNKKLVFRWEFFSGTSGPYFGQGNHNYTIADVDGDGRDEITWGSMAVDDNGKGLYSTQMGHGDAMHVSDLDPYRKGQEVFSCLENSPQHGTLFRDAATGEILHHHMTAGDCGRACAGNISDAYKGAEIWGGGYGYSATTRIQQQHFGVSENFTIYWDGELTKELVDHSNFSTSVGYGFGHIKKFRGYGNIQTLLQADAYSNNYTKGTPTLQADILGDWREEIIWWRTDGQALRIYITPYHTEHRVYTLMHDHHYRQAIAWQMCGYNQPPHTSFYLGSDFPKAIPSKTSLNQLVWKGASATWDLATANWMDGNDAAGLIAGTATVANFANGKAVLLDTRGLQRDINLTSNVSPEALTASGSASYSIAGTGKLTGAMRLVKMGDGSLTVNGNHDFSGNTEVWEGKLWMNGSSSSPVMVRRHAQFGGALTLNAPLNTEYNARISPGSTDAYGTLTVKQAMTLVEGARLELQVAVDAPHDSLVVESTLTLQDGAILMINPAVGQLPEGPYLVAKANALVADLSKVKIEGLPGIATELQYNAEEKSLYLVVKGVRSAAKVNWSGAENGNWDLATSMNWLNNEVQDMFVTGDSVVFGNEATTRTVNITDNLTPAYVEVNNSLPYVFDGTGALSGVMNLYKTGQGALNINNRNNFTGKVIVDGGSLVMKYGPTSTNNGGIGGNETNPAYWIVRNGALTQISTANELTNRGITFEGEEGGVLNVPVNLYWDGIITGTKMTKSGGGTLYIGNSNSGLQEMVLTGGRVKLNASSAVPYGAGRKLTLAGGTLETLNNTGAYMTSSTHFVVPDGATAAIVAGPRCEYNGTLTGGGTLNWTTDFIRAYINGNWSGFTGKINLTRNTANSTYEDKFIVNNAAGFPYATINLGSSDLIMCYKNGTSDNGTTTIKVGMLTGVTGSVFYNAGLEVGALNTSGTFGGSFTGAASIRKVGTGLWILTGESSNTGSTSVNAGTMTIMGKYGSGTISIANGALLNLNGSAGGAAIISNGGTLSINGSLSGVMNNNGLVRGSGTVGGAALLSNGSETQPGGPVIGTMNFLGNVNVKAGATLSVQVFGGSTTADKMAIGGTLTIEGGLLDIRKYGGSWAADMEYQIIDATTITGSFDSITLPELTAGLAWNLDMLYTHGVVKVEVYSSINGARLQGGLLENPTDGLFRVKLTQEVAALQVMVMDLNGRMMVQEQAVPNSEGVVEIDIRHCNTGVYMLQLQAEGGQSTRLKLIKR